jgi:DNA-binding NarL/FixJ family response regulator
VLAALPELEIAGERESLDAPSIAQLGPVDLAVWELSGAEAAAAPRVRELGSSLDCLILVSSDSAVFGLVDAGARGILWRDVDPERLRQAVLAVLAGASVLDQGMTRILLERRALEGSTVELTPREGQVLGLMAEGLSNKLIAARLGISEHTAKFHVNALLEKLGAETRTEAVVRAARQGLLML